jgi:hypothetical protein
MYKELSNQVGRAITGIDLESSIVLQGITLQAQLDYMPNSKQLDGRIQTIGKKLNWRTT